MDDNLKVELEQLTNDVMFGTEEVSAALESGEDRRQLEAGEQVEAIARRYTDLLAKIGAAERGGVENRLGRRVTDLRRAASQLTRRMSGRRVDRAVDAGQVPFLLTREPPRSITSSQITPRDRPKYSVGGEVEAWCGKCGALRDHKIVAMVGDQPKQVLCVSCGSRHGFRTAPARRTADSPSTPSERNARDAGERDQAKRHEARMKLQKELAECAEPRPFDPKGRYKAGEIIIHPTHGRGKIENVLRSSLLVRFLEGLKPLDLS